jgi:hypothetical protein
MRQIKAGEEICSCYKSFQESLNVGKYPPKIFLQKISDLLKGKWGIFCPSDCACQDPAILPLLEEMPRLTKAFANSGKKGDFNTCLAELKTLLELSNNHPGLRGEMTLKVGLLSFAFHAAIVLENRKAEALEFLNEVNEILSKIEFPDSSKSRRYKQIINDPSTYDQATARETFQNLFEHLKN